MAHKNFSEFIMKNKDELILQKSCFPNCEIFHECKLRLYMLTIHLHNILHKLCTYVISLNRTYHTTQNEIVEILRVNSFSCHQK